MLVVSESLKIAHGAIFVIGLALVLLLYWYTISTDIPRIENIPEIPSAVPVFGHLLQLGDDHATVCEAWWRKYRQPLFQIRFGSTRVIVVNSFDTVKRMLTGHQICITDLPTLYTFHNVKSSVQDISIDSYFQEKSCEARRRAVQITLDHVNHRGYHDMYDLQSYCMIRDLYRDFKNGHVSVDVRLHIQKFALSAVLALVYGICIDDVDDELVREILHVESTTLLLQPNSKNYQKYVPFSQHWSNNAKSVHLKELRQRRNVYLNILLAKVEQRVQNGTNKPCIAAAILKDEKTKLTSIEVGSFCLSLFNSVFEKVTSTLTSCIDYLSTTEGQSFQEHAYQDIKRIHDDDVTMIWASSSSEDRSPYITATIREATRYSSIPAISQLHKTITSIRWKNNDGTIATIPPKTTIFFNVQAANRDTDHFGADAGRFNPERWLQPHLQCQDGSRDENVASTMTATATWQAQPITEIPHFGFGAGSHSCPGQDITTRMLYDMFVRLLSCYRVATSLDAPPNGTYSGFKVDNSSAVPVSKDVKVRLMPREGVDVESMLRKWEGRFWGGDL